MAFQVATGYCDLNIPIEGGANPKEKIDIIRRALMLGYQTFALNVSVNQSEISTKGKSGKRKATDSSTLHDFPPPPVLKLETSDYPDLARVGKSPVILTRLTIHFKSNDFLPAFNNSENVKGYDIIAISPETSQSLQNLLKSAFRPDIISFDTEKAQDLKWSRSLYRECTDKGIFFELCYAPMIRDATARRRTIAQGHNYHAVGKSKHIILSSEAVSSIEVRGPHDVANLGFLLGLNENQGKEAVSKLCHEVVRSASGRKLGPYRATVMKLDQLPPDERWKIPGNVKSVESQGEEGESSSSEDEMDLE